eukprot:8025817-Alexandrium_andersonii.AAC.1
MSASLVGSEMCIRDSPLPTLEGRRATMQRWQTRLRNGLRDARKTTRFWACLLYTSDAADDM